MLGRQEEINPPSSYYSRSTYPNYAFFRVAIARLPASLPENNHLRLLSISWSFQSAAVHVAFTSVRPCLDIIRLRVSTWFPNTTTVHLDMNIVHNSMSLSKILVTKSWLFAINRTLQCCMYFFFIKLCCFSSRTSAATFTTGWTTATVPMHYIRSTWRHLCLLKA